MAQRTVEQIEELLHAYASRGEMTRRGFCESRGISSSLLDYYVRRYGKRKSGGKTKLVKVRLEESTPATDRRFSVVLANGRRIESAWGFIDAELLRLVRLVESA